MAAFGVPRSVGTRLALFLTLALLPLGLIAVWQTGRMVEEARTTARLTLTALTQHAAQQERQTIERSLGAAAALGTVALQLRDAPEACSDAFRAFVASVEDYSFAGFLPLDGLMRCSSHDAPFDFSGFPDFERSMARPVSRVSLNVQGPISGTAVMVVSHPVREAGAFAGYVSVSTPRQALSFDLAHLEPLGAFTVVTFNADGAILGANADLDTARTQLPADLPLTDLARDSITMFQAVGADGAMHVYAVAPIVAGVAYAIGSWREDTLAARSLRSLLPAYGFPLGMWLASLAVAYLAVHRVVIKHVRRLQSDMRGFALHRRLPSPPDAEAMPSEFADMQRTFLRTASILMRDEVALESALHEQKVLLKEVHHRVKNNLQLISSIMSLQMRKAESAEVKLVLRRLQDRVLGLAAIHRNLYRSESLSQVQADRMLEEIVGQMTRVALPVGSRVETRLSLDPVSLYPDQIVPLSLLASEAVTNALKYIGRPADGPPRIGVELRALPEGGVFFSVRNTLGAPLETAEESGGIQHGDGLGDRMIRAFASQLGGELEISSGPGEYVLSLRFARLPFADPEPQDGEAPEAAAEPRAAGGR